MKKQTLYHIAVSVLFLFFGSLPAWAQSQEYLMTVQVPFDFQVNKKLLPAGEYTFKRIPNTPEVLIIQGSDLSTVIAFTNFSGWSEAPMQSGLTFNEYGEKRFLSEVRVAQRGFQYSLVKSKAEHELAQTHTLIAR